MTPEEMLAAMRVKPKEEVKKETSSLGMDDVEIIEVPVPKREDPSKILDAPRVSKEPDTNALLLSLIAQVRRTNTLLEQLRQIQLGQPLSDYKSEVSENGER